MHISSLQLNPHANFATQTRVPAECTQCSKTQETLMCVFILHMCVCVHVHVCVCLCMYLCFCVCSCSHLNVQAGLNEYCNKTKIELEESLHKTLQGEWECVLRYSSCLRDFTASGAANGEKRERERLEVRERRELRYGGVRENTSVSVRECTIESTRRREPL